MDGPLPFGDAIGGAVLLGAIVYDWMKGGKQHQRDRDYGLPPELIDWWHNGGGKAGHGGQDIGSEYGPAPGEILQEWEDLGRPGGSKPKGRRYPR